MGGHMDFYEHGHRDHHCFEGCTHFENNNEFKSLIKPELECADVNNAFFESLNHIPNMIWILSDAGHPVFINQFALDFLGIDQAEIELENSGWNSWIHTDDLDAFLKGWSQPDGVNELQFELRMTHNSGEYRWVSLSLKPLTHLVNSQSLWLLTGVDIHGSKLQQLKMSEQIQAQTNMLDASIDCIKLLNIDGTLLHVNRSGALALNLDPTQNHHGVNWPVLLPDDIRVKAVDALQLAAQGQTVRFEGVTLDEQGKKRYWDNVLTPILNLQGQTERVLCMSRDVTNHIEVEKRLRDASEIDELTGLFNRRSLKQHLKQTIHHQKDSKQIIGLMLLDLDYFKHINDTLGHAAGDHLLRVLSKRIKAALPDHIFVARLGGDEFAIVINDIRSEYDLTKIANEIIQQLDAPIIYAGNIINGSMSIGCAVYPKDAKDAVNLMKCADTALNDLKATGRGGYRMFNRHMQNSAEQIAIQLNRARQIIRDDLITPFYQPKINLIDGRVIGFEVLLRWKDAFGVFHPPSSVEEAFQDYVLATRISDAIQNKVFAHMSVWLDNNLPLLPVSINAAPVEFLKDDYAERLLERLAQYHIPHHMIEIEITEHVLDERGADYVIRALHVLKEKGIRIALDDFGTGHSSLTRLMDYPVQCLKIDRGFIDRMNDDESILAIVLAILELGPKLNLDVVAEGIENHKQLQLLRQNGCLIAQGFLFSEAVNFEDVTQILIEKKVFDISGLDLTIM